MSYTSFWHVSFYSIKLWPQGQMLPHGGSHAILWICLFNKLYLDFGVWGTCGLQYDWYLYEWYSRHSISGRYSIPYVSLCLTYFLHAWHWPKDFSASSYYIQFYHHVQIRNKSALYKIRVVRRQRCSPGDKQPLWQRFKFSKDSQRSRSR